LKNNFTNIAYTYLKQTN